VPNKSVYDFRLRKLEKTGAVFKATTALTAGISKKVSWWNPDSKLEFDGTLWELQPTELRARVRPNVTTTPLAQPEQNVFTKTGVNLETLKTYLIQNPSPRALKQAIKCTMSPTCNSFRAI
jgi:hypothetical protein